MSGITNSAYEENELEMIESGRAKMESINRKETRDNSKSGGCLAAGRNAVDAFLSRNRKVVKFFGLVLLNLLIITYLVFASMHWKNNRFEKYGFEWCEGYGMLIIILGITYGGLFYYWIFKPLFGRFVIGCCQPVSNFKKRLGNTKHGIVLGQSVIYLIIFAGIIIFLILDTVGSRERLISASAIVVLLSFGCLFSKHPANINWRPVLCGLILQFVFGLITIRWAVGRAIFQCLSNKVATFLDFAKSGAAFIFSQTLITDGVFAFAVLPVIFYFSFMIQILYYMGVMQWVIMKLGWALQSMMGTTLCESINCAANTFIGMSESPLLIKPYISKLTTSEFHAIMCSGFASVSGTVLAAYIGFGAEPAHLITASVMSAPASLCFSKLFYPETEKSLTSFDNIQLEKSKDSSILDAATKGALAGIPIVLGIIANIVSFVSFIALINALLTWLGFLVGYQNVTFEWILSRLFMPLSWIIGVPWDRCEEVGTLIGLKTVVNEFIAYQKLGEYKKQGLIYGRTEAIATYAICGFANPSSIGIMIGVLSSLAPEKKEQITGCILRAFIAGTVVCLMTASIAGMLMDDSFFQTAVNSTIPNSTLAMDVS